MSKPSAFRPEIGPPPADIVKVLAPSGILRAGINLSNFRLVSARTANGGPAGVSPDIARAIADHLGLAIQYVPYPSPGLLADAAGNDEWDIGLIGAEPQRAEVISFTPAYAEIEATYLVPAGSRINAIDEVDQAGTRIAVTGRTAYGLWLERSISKAELFQTSSFDETLKDFREQEMEALAGLRPYLMTDAAALPGARILPGRFMSVQQAVGTPKAKSAAIPYLTRFVEAASASGFVDELIRHHKVQGLSAA